MPDAATVTRDQLAQVLATVGLDPPDPNRYRSLLFQTASVTAVRYSLADDGKKVILSDGMAATETIEISVVRT